MAATNGSSNGTVPCVPLWINGEEVKTSTTFDVVAPSSHKLLWHCSAASPSDATAAVEAASNAFKSWRKTKPAAMRTIFLKAADIMEERSEELASYMIEETGSSGMVAGGFNLPVTIEMFRDVSGRISGIMGAIPTVAEEGSGAFIFREPYGVVLGIVP
ncbi:hypothetical protein LTR66_011133, partial [Elasticomyces elasticus]